ncbi:Chaperone surA [Rhynchospora pubera]|uniref:Chaperone surA n=1 Tax=Rhynchospora pubera TaxID=906938 RepID=A0AAV8ARC3_9POAL|nr:Chaperone surA [Rhynchospora pubera]KAJ4751979.1 Chaperone surA [Rhynchospora pubera]KAJ4795061.1 Chaperone surA [Rhynchospora pubera]
MINLALSLPLSPSTLPKPLRFSPLQIPPPLSTTHLHVWNKKRRTFPLLSAYTEYSSTQFNNQWSDDDNEPWSTAKRDAFLKGGEQVVSIMQEMLNLLEDMEVNMDTAAEPVALELVAQGVIGKRVDEMESGFMMALDYMINLAKKDNDDQRKSLLEVIKQTVLDHLTKKCPPQVQVVGLLCQTAKKDSRHELLRRVVAGGGVFESETGLKVHLPAANLNDIANQADDLLESMEERPTILDRKLLARLVLVREEARNMMGGGLLDERNDRGLSTLPEAEVNFLSKLVMLKPGEAVKMMISDAMHGRAEGEDIPDSGDGDTDPRAAPKGIFGTGSVSGRKPRPVRPGMFLETVTKVLGGLYAGHGSGVTAQHLEWVHRKTLEILEEMAY